MRNRAVSNCKAWSEYVTPIAFSAAERYILRVTRCISRLRLMQRSICWSNVLSGCSAGESHMPDVAQFGTKVVEEGCIASRQRRRVVRTVRLSLHSLLGPIQRPQSPLCRTPSLPKLFQSYLNYIELLSRHCLQALVSEAYNVDKTGGQCIEREDRTKVPKLVSREEFL